MAAFLAPHRRIFEVLKGEEAVELSLKMKMGNSVLCEQRTSTYHELFWRLLGTRFYKLESLISHDDRVKRTKGKELVVAIIESLFTYFQYWMVESDASVASECIRLLSLFAAHLRC
jgi:hypothetical protein